MNTVSRYSRNTKNYVEYRKMLDSYETDWDKTVESLKKRLDGASGLFKSEIIQADGSTKYYLHDRPQLNESNVILQITNEAVAISTDGGKTWPTGITVNGDAILNILRVKGMSANWMTSGEIKIQDEKGNTIFSANIDTGTVYINGDCIKIGDKPLNTVLQESKALTMSLKPEYRTISVDAEGQYEQFPDVRVIPAVYYGTVDITEQCSFIIEKSSWLEGYWDNTEKTYTVTELNADEAWADIKAVYLTYTVTKRFSISKLYAGKTGSQGTQGPQGEKGDPGENVYLDVSHTVIKKMAKGLLSPSHILFSAKHTDADNAKKPYDAFFIIEETEDGDNWQEVYRSESIEESVDHYLYSALLDANGIALKDPAGYVLATSRQIAGVRCSIYNGNNDLFDRQNISVVTEATALTQSQIVEILSADGTWKGLYYLNGHLYISFDAALGGELTLGGVNNGNGLLRIRDEEGNVIGYIDNTGANFNQGRFSGKVQAAQIEGSEVTGSTILSDDGNTATKVESGSVRLRNTAMDEGAYIEDPDTGELIYVGDVEADWSDSGDVANAGYLQTESRYYPDFAESTAVTEDDVAVISLDAFWGLFILAEKAAIASFGKNKISLNGETIISGAATIGEDLDVLNSSGSGNGQVHCKKLWTTSLQVDGTKSRMVSTQNYQEQYLHAYETPAPMFGDVGSSALSESGEDVILINDMFLEVINSGIEYQVFLQKEGPGDIWIEEKTQLYFSVKGTPGLRYSWEMKAVQRDYEHIRFDDVSVVFQESELENIEKELINVQEKELKDMDEQERQLLADLKGEAI